MVAYRSALIVAFLAVLMPAGLAAAGQNDAFKKLLADAEAGSVDAMYSLGLAYERAQPPDLMKATGWFLNAAERGHLSAMLRAGNAYEDGDGVLRSPETAFQWYEKAAQNNVVDAMVQLAAAYENGAGVPADSARAVEWFRRAANLNSSLAMFNLGIAYENGRGIGKNEGEAIEWYEKAAKAGSARAMFRLGLYYATGQHVGKDIEKALTWWQSAAKAGDAAAMANLGSIFLFGNGVPADPKQALDWSSKGAERQNATAMFNLGQIYSRGMGVTADPVTGFMWFDLAARNGRGEIATQAERSRNDLRTRMVPAQIQAAETRSLAWAPTPVKPTAGMRNPVPLSTTLGYPTYMRIGGKVVVEFIVDIDGRVRAAKIVETSYKLSDEKGLLRAIERLRYRPARTEAGSVPATMTVSFSCPQNSKGPCSFNHVKSP
jgi:TonB family protein